VTREVDLTLLTGFGAKTIFLDPLLAAYEARVEDARELPAAIASFLLKSPSGVGIDISLGALPFEEALVRHATAFTKRRFPSVQEIEIRPCSCMREL